MEDKKRPMLMTKGNCIRLIIRSADNSRKLLEILKGKCDEVIERETTVELMRLLSSYRKGVELLKIFNKK